MSSYTIEWTENAKVDLSFFTAFERKIIVTRLKEQLLYEPLKETKNRKKLRDNPIASYELRIGRYRVFYDVVGDTITINIVSVGKKEHNVLYIRDKEVKI
ncbi:MAG: type II toxin-antitoxin system RelE/ParE family toxin [Pseudomonadota bacterium]